LVFPGRDSRWGKFQWVGGGPTVGTDNASLKINGWILDWEKGGRG